MAKTKGQRAKTGFNIISENPSEELKKLEEQLSKQNSETKADSGNEEKKALPEIPEGGATMDEEVKERFSKLEEAVGGLVSKLEPLSRQVEIEEQKQRDEKIQTRLKSIAEERLKPLADKIEQTGSRVDEVYKMLCDDKGSCKLVTREEYDEGMKKFKEPEISGEEAKQLLGLEKEAPKEPIIASIHEGSVSEMLKCSTCGPVLEEKVAKEMVVDKKFRAKMLDKLCADDACRVELQERIKAIPEEKKEEIKKSLI